MKSRLVDSPFFKSAVDASHKRRGPTEVEVCIVGGQQVAEKIAVNQSDAIAESILNVVQMRSIVAKVNSYIWPFASDASNLVGQRMGSAIASRMNEEDWPFRPAVCQTFQHRHDRRNADAAR